MIQYIIFLDNIDYGSFQVLGWEYLGVLIGKSFLPHVKVFYPPLLVRSWDRIELRIWAVPVKAWYALVCQNLSCGFSES